MATPGAEACSWCGVGIDPSESFRAFEPAEQRRAGFCRLEHLVPWAMQGPHWEAGAVSEPDPPGEPPGSCARCGSELGDAFLLLVHHRGEHRVNDRFCSVEHMADWAKAGGRWG